MYHKIVVPVDSSALSRRALGYAIELSRHTGAELTVFYINPIVPIYYGGPMPQRHYVPLEKEDAENRLSSILSNMDLESFAVKKKMASGNPVAQIVRVAKEEKANLIVMGSRGFNWLTGILLGSVSQLVVKHAPCPVLIVK